MEVSNLQFVDVARTWVGVPFRHQGRTRRGVDCIGLMLAVAWEMKLLPQSIDRPTYGRLPVDGSLEAEVEKYCTQTVEHRPGVLFLMRFSQSVTHVSLLTERDTLIHSYESVGRVVEHGFRAPWPVRVVSAWTINLLTYK